jgi:hypothetical protein
VAPKTPRCIRKCEETCRSEGTWLAMAVTVQLRSGAQLKATLRRFVLYGPGLHSLFTKVLLILYRILCRYGGKNPKTPPRTCCRHTQLQTSIPAHLGNYKSRTRPASSIPLFLATVSSGQCSLFFLLGRTIASRYSSEFFSKHITFYFRFD